MGSFNTTCFASQQTIAPGERCLVIPLIQKSTYTPAQATYGEETHELHGVTSSTCYPTAFWRPMGAFFDAKYDDYGRVVLEQTESNLSGLLEFLRYVLNNTPVVALGKNHSHDLAFDFRFFLTDKASSLGAWLLRRREDPSVTFDAQQFFAEGVLCWDYIWEVAFENRLFGADYNQQLRPLTFAVLHKRAQELLVADTEAQTDWYDATLEQRAFFDRIVAKASNESADRCRSGDPHGMRSIPFMDCLRQELQAVGNFEGSSYPAESAVLTPLAQAHLRGDLSADELFIRMKDRKSVV